MKGFLYLVFAVALTCWQALADEKIQVFFEVDPPEATFFVWGAPEHVAKGRPKMTGPVGKEVVLSRQMFTEGPVACTFRAEGYIEESRVFDVGHLVKSSDRLVLPPNNQKIVLTKKPSLIYLSLLVGGCLAGLTLGGFAVRRRKLAEKKLQESLESLRVLRGSVDELSGILDGIKKVSTEQNDVEILVELENFLASSVSSEAGVIWEQDSGEWRSIHRWPELSPQVFQRIPRPGSPGQLSNCSIHSGSEWPNHVVTAVLTPSPLRVATLCRADDPFSPEELDLIDFCLYQTRQTLDNRRLISEAQSARKKFESSQRELLQVARMNAVGDLGAGVAHELNTPLGAASLSIEASMSMLGNVPKPVENLLKNGLDAIGNCQKIINQLLDFSRAGLGEESAVSLKATVESATQLLSHQAQTLGVSFESQYRDEPVVQGRPNELRQLILNICKNALEASAKGGKVSVELLENQGRAVVKIKDEGEGIPPGDLDRVFAPFFSTRSVAKGRGLGLSICEEIALRHSARIDITSEVGRGTEVVVTFDHGAE